MTKSESQSESTPQQIPLWVLLEPLKKPLKAQWRLAVLTILAGWGKFVLPMGVPLITGHLIDDVLLQPADADTQVDLFQLGGVSLLLLFVLGISAYYRSRLAQELASNLQHNLRRRMFYHIQRLSMRFFNRHHAGSLGSRVSSDITYAGVVVDKGLIQLSLDGLSLLTLGGVMLYINPWLALLCFVFLSGNALVVRHYSPGIRSGRKDIQEQQSSVTGRAAEYFSAITVVKAFAGEGQSGREFSASSEQVRDLQVANSKLQGAFQSLSNTLVIACQIAVALVGSYMILYHPGSLSRGDLVGFLLFVGLINGSVQRLTDSLIQIQDGFAALERIHDILEISPSPADQENALTPRLTGKMRFEDVAFGYQQKQVLHDLSFELEAGKTYALVGPSGSGKSTLTQLMLRFYDPWEGRILLDEYPLTEISQSHYRHQVAVVLQDPIIFSTSVRENIGFAVDDATDEDIEKAARAAQAHEFILEMPKGYDSRLGERGVALSGGQRQRIAIARALMRDPRILILDEATSALDSVTERHIQAVVDQLRGTRTVVIIAHRLSTVRNVDEILVMDKGRLAERGNYQTLKNKKGIFAELLEQQKMERSEEDIKGE
jgi:ABC-type multidrug transport system fused ATPase/permease subunit